MLAFREFPHVHGCFEEILGELNGNGLLFGAGPFPASLRRRHTARSINMRDIGATKIEPTTAEEQIGPVARCFRRFKEYETGLSTDPGVSRGHQDLVRLLSELLSPERLDQGRPRACCAGRLSKPSSMLIPSCVFARTSATRASVLSSLLDRFERLEAIIHPLVTASREKFLADA
jgi:hypothetical protein